MRKLTHVLCLLSLVWWLGCGVKTPAQPELNITANQLVLSKMVALGNSHTAGFQSGGLRDDFQQHSYPFLIAQQIGKAGDFELPLIAAPGIGSTPGKQPLKLENGKIVTPDLQVSPTSLLLNALLARPYDNLGVPGATLRDMLNATGAATSAAGTNSFFDLVLRNPNLGSTTPLQQVALLNPTLVLLWIGDSDVLGAALSGGNPAMITPLSDFQARYTTLLTELRQKTRAALVMANVPNATDLPYLNTMDFIFRPIPALGITTPVPVVFDAKFQPVDFDPTANTLYVPLMMEEKEVAHLTLPALSAYQTGLGIPDGATLLQLGLPVAQAQALEQGMRAAGLNPTGQPFPGTMSITAAEKLAIQQAVAGFNSTLQTLAGQFQAAIVDCNSLMATLSATGLEGYSGRFVLLDPQNTAFSLDGVHPNNGGYALIANAFIDKINATFQLAIPKLNPAEYKGQYLGAAVTGAAAAAVAQVQALY